MENRTPKNRYNGGAAPDTGKHTDKPDVLKMIETAMDKRAADIAQTVTDMGNAHADTVNIIPMTRHLKKPELPCHTHLFPDSISDIHQHLDPSMILAEQLTTVSKHALRSYAGHISDADAMNRIETAVIAQLFLERRHPECL